MKKIFHLGACSTNARILKEIQPDASVEMQDIKLQNIDAATLDWLKEKVGSYEALFSKKAMKYRGMGLHLKTLSENDYRQLMLDEYTFLKRPFMINGEEVFIGNTKAVVEGAVQSFQKK
ncbi:MAG: ArsC/Spx/MgsR family protein [Bacteroidota bacterium]